MQRRMNGRSAPPASAALTQELHDIVESDRHPFWPRIRTLGHTREAQAGAGSRALAPAEAAGRRRAGG
jgi:hypothetical protein